MRITCKKIPLKEVATFLNGYAFKPSDWSKEGLPIIRIQNLTGTNKEFNYYNGDYNKKYIIEDGDILISWSASLGIFLWKNMTGILNQHIFKVIFDKNIEIDKIYFLHCMKFLIKKLEKNIHGSTMKHITRPEFEKIKFPIYDIDIQRKISKKIIFITKIIENNQKLLDELLELSKSLFTKYSIGEKESIANLCYVKARIGWQGLTKKEYLSDGEYYLITGVDFKNEKIDFKNCFHITEQRYNQDENIKVKINDILLTKDGTIGKVAIVDKLEKPASLNSGVFVLRPKVNNLNVIYLMHSLISDDFKKFIDDIKIGATVPHLNQTALLKYKVILPPIELQNKFAERVEKIEKLKFEIEKSIEEAKKLYDSLIFKYFDN